MAVPGSASAASAVSGVVGAVTTLHEVFVEAAAAGDLERVKSLRGEGADINAAVKEGRTALMGRTIPE